MPTITLGDIKLRARQKADMVNSNFIEDPELLNYVNEAYFTWYDLVVAAFEDYYLDDPTEFTIAAGGAAEYILPADFYKLAGLDKASTPGTGRFYTLRKTTWRGRNQTESSYGAYSRVPLVTYRIIKDKIIFVPKESADGTYRLWYIPLATPLVDDVDSINTYNGFENLLIVDVAIKMLNKEESDVSVLMGERAILTAKLQEMLIDRDINNGERIEEVNEYGSDTDGGYFW